MKEFREALIKEIGRLEAVINRMDRHPMSFNIMSQIRLEKLDALENLLSNWYTEEPKESEPSSAPAAGGDS
jgi:hypothetical protein